MGNDLDRYRQSPSVFRNQIRQRSTNAFLWLFDGSKGGEVGRAVVGYFKPLFRKRQQKPFNWIEQQLQKTPTWLFVSGAVLILSGFSLWVEDGIEIKSGRDVVKVVFANAESIAIAAAVILYFKEIPDRKEQKHYEAWQVIDNAAAAKTPTSYARYKALEDLNRDRVSLRGVDIPGADLEKIDLQGVNFQEADLREAKLQGADLRGANLRLSKLQGAELQDANLQGADLQRAKLQEANLCFSKLQGADLQSANLQGADLLGAKLQDANLRFTCLQEAKLQDAKLQGADLQMADLLGANLRFAKLQGANLQTVLNLSKKELTLAKLCRTKLPEGIDLDPDRDCETE